MNLTEKKAWQWANALQHQLTEKLQIKVNPPPQASVRAAGGDDRFVFLEGELLIFGNITRSDVIAAMNDMGVEPGAYTVITDGPPLYFTNQLGEDTSYYMDYFLAHSDLPYGFAESDGTFRFSSQEISGLTLPAEPQIVDDCYAYYGTNADRVKYEDISNPSKIDKYCPMMFGLGWAERDDKANALADIKADKYANVCLDAGERVDRRFFVDKDDFIRDLNDISGSASNIVGGLGMNNYNPGKYIGWRWNLIQKKAVDKNLIPAYILSMPPGQLTEFEVNPSSQQPYRGAEGVYPVILVELNEDVNVLF